MSQNRRPRIAHRSVDRPARAARCGRPAPLLAMALGLAAACQSGAGPGSEAAAQAASEAPPQFRPADGTVPSEAAAAPEAQANHAVRTSVTRADDGSVTLVTEVTAANGFHINTDLNFPWRVKVAEDAPVAAGTTLGASDASTMREDLAAFTIPVAEPGDAAEVKGEVVLGVCDDEGCIRVREEVTWALAGQ